MAPPNPQSDPRVYSRRRQPSSSRMNQRPPVSKGGRGGEQWRRCCAFLELACSLLTLRPCEHNTQALPANTRCVRRVDFREKRYCCKPILSILLFLNSNRVGGHRELHKES